MKAEKTVIADDPEEALREATVMVIDPVFWEWYLKNVNSQANLSTHMTFVVSAEQEPYGHIRDYCSWVKTLEEAFRNASYLGEDFLLVWDTKSLPLLPDIVDYELSACYELAAEDTMYQIMAYRKTY